MMPTLAGDGLLVAGDAAALCLAAGIWLEGVNFAIGSGLVAGEVAAAEALAAGDTSARRPGRLPPAPRRRRSCWPTTSGSARSRTSCCRTGCSTSTRSSMCDVVERMFRVDNPEPKPGLRRIVRDESRRGRRAPARPRHGRAGPAARSFG